MSCWQQRPKHIRYLSIGEYLNKYANTPGRKAAVQNKYKALAAQQSATADTALDALPPQIGYSNSISAGGGGQTALDMLGGPEETLG